MVSVGFCGGGYSVLVMLFTRVPVIVGAIINRPLLGFDNARITCYPTGD